MTRGDLRSRVAAGHAVCPRKERRAAGGADAAYVPAVAHRSADGRCELPSGQLAEFGVIENKGIENVGELVRMLDGDDEDLAQIPASALMVMKILADQLRAVDAHVSAIDEQIEAWQRENAAAQTLETIPGIGALISAALAAHVPDPSIFRSGHDFAAWLGLVPRQNSSGGKERLGRITKERNPYLRRLLVLGATASLRWLHKRTDPLADWTKRLLQRPAGAARYRGARQQAGADRLGGHDDGRALPLKSSDGARIAAIQSNKSRRTQPISAAASCKITGRPQPEESCYNVAKVGAERHSGSEVMWTLRLGLRIAARRRGRETISN